MLDIKIYLLLALMVIIGSFSVAAIAAAIRAIAEYKNNKEQ